MNRSILILACICCHILFESFKLPIRNTWHVYLNEREISKTYGDTIVELRLSSLNQADTLTLNYSPCSPFLVQTYSRIVFKHFLSKDVKFRETKSFASYDAKVTGKELLEYIDSNSPKIIPLNMQSRHSQTSKWSREFLVTKLKIID